MGTTLHDLLQRAADGRRARCAVCGDEATTMVEMVLSRNPPRGKRRGELLRSRTQRMCDRHAGLFFKLLDNPKTVGQGRAIRSAE